MKWNLAAVLAVFCFVNGALAQPTVFTYQGRLNFNNAAANGQFDMTFTLHNALASGFQVGNALTNAPVDVTNGLFTTSLDFGAGVFDGNPRWLQIGVRANGDTNQYVTLAPRQPLTATPYAIRAAIAGSANGLTTPLQATNITGIVQQSNLPVTVAYLNTSPTFSGTVTAAGFNGPVAAGNLTGIVPDARLSTNVAFLNTNAFFRASLYATNFSGDGGGLTNVPGFKYPVIPTAANVQAFRNVGYLATNDTSAVVVTLPDSPLDVGDSIRVSASGAGGWVIAQKAGQTILVGNLLNSTAQSFTPRGASAVYRGVASSADGKKWVAASSGGMYTSPDYATTWTLQAGSPAAQCVAASADGAKVVAGVSGGQIFTSINSGTNWTGHNPSTTWSGVASSLDGVKLAATISGASGAVYTSIDSGGSWVPKLSPGNFTAIASSADGSRLAATSTGGLIAISTDSGATWAARDSSRTWSSIACSADGMRLIASVSSGLLYLSSDGGTNWFTAGPSANTAWTAVSSSTDGSKLAAVFTTGGIHMSTDWGVTWVPRNISSSVSWTDVGMSSDASTVVVAGTSAQFQVSSQATTTVGVTGGLVGTRLAAVELQYCGGGVFIPVSFVGNIRPK